MTQPRLPSVETSSLQASVQPETIVIYPMIPRQKEFQPVFTLFAATAPILNVATPMYEPTQARRSAVRLPHWVIVLEAHHALNATSMSVLIMLTRVSVIARTVACHMSTAPDNYVRLLLEV